MSDELVQWFGEQLNEDERIAKAAPPGPWIGTDAEDVGAWSVYDPEWLIASATVYTHNEPMGGKRGPGYINASATTAHIAEWDPARALREIDAKRAVLTAYAEVAENYGRDDVEYADGWVSALRFAVRQLATAYSNRPGYLDEWRP